MKARCISWIIVIAIISLRPFIGDMINMAMDLDTMAPSGDLKSWIFYLVWVAVILFLLIVIGWYHCKCSAFRDKDKISGEIKFNDTCIWVITEIVGSAIVLITSGYPYPFLL